MKKFLLNLTFTAVLLSAGYSQCNESNWQSYYPDMQGCDLSGADLSGAYLYEADLSGAYLYEANLSGAILSYADLSYANLSGAILSYADLSYANLSGANLAYANLFGAILYGAILYEAYLCNLTGSPSGDVCEESGGITDDNADGYDDASYAAGAASVDTNNDGLVDEFPIISIIEGNAIVLIQGSLEEYTDSGANCTDQEDGDLSNQVVVSGNIPNMNNPGIYTVSYNCSDSSGNVAQTKHRIVFIVDEYLFFDENEDGFDDNSYTTGFYNGEETGDVNHSGELSITDIIIIIDNILNGE